MQELVSIIMPSYNAERFIEESINSVLSQTYQNWELLITDDVSKDNTVAIVKQYAINEPRIRLVEKSNGAYWALFIKSTKTSNYNEIVKNDCLILEKSVSGCSSITELCN
ncbi:glycosyltransferase family 2 protein [Pseudoalteromonas sp. NGC95]|uniref:glycosyltransferase family 2 protein n=1 Tax=Pseudoalteromonas sp. NGC95 TaxID=2792051 RepID=UPI001E551A7B|nr:glycosyltransferase [Pseudoalteromonas sp. NGC95]